VERVTVVFMAFLTDTIGGFVMEVIRERSITQYLVSEILWLYLKATGPFGEVLHCDGGGTTCTFKVRVRDPAELIASRV
jgi:hypothetical protein